MILKGCLLKSAKLLIDAKQMQQNGFAESWRLLPNWKSWSDPVCQVHLSLSKKKQTLFVFLNQTK